MTNIYRPETVGLNNLDVVGGRLDLVSATSIRLSFLNSNQIRLYNPTSAQWELVKCSAEPTLLNNADDMNGTALAVDKIYDVFAEYSSSTAFTLKCSRWASYGAGTSSRVAAYASGTTYAIGDRVTYGGHDWVKQSSAAAGATPVAGDDWVDNGTSVSGDFAGLYRHDGVLVSDSSTTGKSRRWLGIIYTYNNSGTVNFKDDNNYRFVSNFYNRLSKYGTLSYSGSAYTYNSSIIREVAGGTSVTRCYIVSASSQNCNCSRLYRTDINSLQCYPGPGIGINSTTTSVLPDFEYYVADDTEGGGGLSCNTAIAAGYNYMALVERAGGSSTVMWGGQDRVDR